MKKLIICFDGIPYEMFSRENTPYLYSYAKKNHLLRLRTLFAFTGIEHSFFSGKYPDEHNVWLEHKYSPKTSPFKWQKKLKFFPRNLLSFFTSGIAVLKGRKFISQMYKIPYKTIHNFDFSAKKGIWEQKLFKNKKYLCYKWPFLVKNNKIKLKLRYESDKQRARTLIKNISKDIDIYSVQLVGLDKTIHKYGIKSKKTRQKIKETDKIIKTTIKEFERKFPDNEIYVWSDHGFIDIKHYINLQKLLPKSTDYLTLIGGTSVSFWFKNKKIKKKITNILKKQKFGFILTEKLRKKYRIPKSIEHGELIFAVNPEYYIFPNYYQTKNPFKSMHSYPTDKADINGILVTNKETSKKQLNIPEVADMILR